MTSAEIIKGYLPRDVPAHKCACGGYCEEAETTPEEFKQVGCTRGKGCCDKAFVCIICRKRYIGKLEAPDAG